MELLNNFKIGISEKGFCHIPKGGQSVLTQLLKELGQVIQEKDIFVTDVSEKRTNSKKRMRLHTDHPYADYVIWHCIVPSSEGGKTRLSDLSSIYKGLNEFEKKILSQSRLKNVKLFNSCKSTHPIITLDNGVEKFYFVPWFLQDDETTYMKSLFQKIEDAAVANEICFLLEKDDLLMIDNKRILHGRTEISGSGNRLLKRYWIKSKIDETI